MTAPAPRISEDELARLEELAGKATPGPWHRLGDWQVQADASVHVASTRLIYDAAYIAALSPDVVLRLIAAARSAPAAGLDAERLRQIEAAARDAVDAAGTERWPVNCDALRAALAAEEVR